MSKQFRPGSMGAADQKANRRFVIGAAVLILLIALLCYLPLGIGSINFFYLWHENAKSGAKHFAFIPFALAFLMCYFSNKTTFPEKSGSGYWILVLLFVAAGIGLSSGFVFDLK